MIIGVPKEIKDNENRVALTPGGTVELIGQGHRVLVQVTAGDGSGFSDEEYVAAGAEMVADAAGVFARADMILKVKEPISPEFDLLRENQILFTYLHLAAAEELAHVLAERKVKAVAYETIKLPDGSLPLLMPMSEIAGRMSVQDAAILLERSHGGRGVLLGGVPGVLSATVSIVGGGTVGINAAKMALGLGAKVIIIDNNLQRLRYLDDVLFGRYQTLASTQSNIAEAVKQSDVVIGGVLVPGARAPRLVTREMIKTMAPGAVVIDVAVDQGGCIETIKPTTHSDPTYVVDGVLHYGVTNMPGAVPRTSTFALTNATLPYVRKLADNTFEEIVMHDETLREGVNAYGGYITYRAVAADLNMEYRELSSLV